VDDLEGFKEHLARLRSIDAEHLEFRGAQTTAETHIEAPVGQIVEHRRLLGGEHRIAERQNIDHAGKPDMARPPRGGGDRQNWARGPAPSAADDAQRTRSD
jgi:hypothetical protein